ncbi:phage major capsid protein [Rhodococcus sp. H36-A4]|uniref:phage major capsid protein n=1 Tax=Rhodococcus sp. H36-A4 TaxID=3004353 RepID=UPI0022AEC8C1|nr:phage major capsid protein [Rhodococcus sp. H36-A4]MCZ4077279.1 phage major capsid protein [Rhodococcus sp. H36-A4]
MFRIKQLQEEAVDVVKSARAIAEKATGEDREMNTDERGRFDAEMTKGRELLDQLKAAKENEAEIETLKSLGGPLGPDDRNHSTGSKFLGITGPAVKGLARSIAGTMLREENGRKAVAPVGVSLTQIPLLSQSPVDLPRALQTFLEVIPSATESAPSWSYLKQTVRTNNAAPVAVGAVKPTSLYTWDKADGALHVIAHMSEPIDKYLLEDVNSLTSWIENELLYGLRVAVENQVLNGSGTAPALRGLNNVSGVQTQAFATNLLTTARQAITKLEIIGKSPSVFVLSPSDWESLELSSTTAAAVDYRGLPVDRATQKLWGVPVSLSTALAAKAGVLLDTSTLRIVTDTQGVELKWSENYADDFAKNQLRARCEGRFELEVQQPLGTVKIATQAA